MADHLAVGTHALGGAAGRDGFGHDAGEVAGAAADVENPVPWAGAALGGQPGEDTTSAAAGVKRSEDVVASMPQEDAGCAAANRRAVQEACPFHLETFH